ncbi:winged helix-turn-helix transcriptional regulator [Nocardiopsis listeri]|uniref:winged helix-turn-helix transcriptional regulator n=1 Tax=Nocardiopsis listeri TaxID=53440 RepID=UPI000835412A|nr:helix-turn-helix domain-containing protein [Nocardiopsis listeri]
MSVTNSGVPIVLSADLGLPVTTKEHESCPVTDVLRRVGDKWSVLVVVVLGRGPKRFSQLDRSIEDISQRMLTRTLRALQRDGLVTRTVYPTVPATVEYELTDMGRTLLDPLSALTEWAIAHRPDIEQARIRHDEAEVRPSP